MTYVPVFQISKKLDFIKVFLKVLVFKNFGGQKLKILTFRVSHFVERVILHLERSFCVVTFKTLFLTNFFNIEPILVKIFVK